MASEGSRELTAAEKAAVDRVERALSKVPRSIVLFFNESGLHVVDSEVWAGQSSSRSGYWLEEESSDHRPIKCRYDTGAI